MCDKLNRALIIHEYWLNLILSGEKVWEMRATATKFRGRFGLIQKGSGLIFGEATLVDSLPALNKSDFYHFTKQHQIHHNDDISLKWRFPWVLENVVRYPSQIQYSHPRGAVIWVKI